MADSIIINEIVHRLENMPYELQKKVLEFASSVEEVEPLKGVPGSVLLQFAGSIDKEDLRLMEEAIEEGCERIDEDGW